MSSLENIAQVGPSIGWLFAKLGSTTQDVQEYITAVKKTCADALELNIVEPESERRLAILGLPDTALLDFPFLSLHLGSFRGFPAHRGIPDTWVAPFDEYRRLCQKHQFDVAPAHPDTLPPHAFVLSMFRRIPVALENMDAHKPTGKMPSDLACYMSVLSVLGFSGLQFRWVLDVQHAYEVALEKGMAPEQLVRDFCVFMRENLAHLHVSGEIREGDVQKVQHAQLHAATNRDVIFELTRIALEETPHALPIILEGEPLLDIPCGGTRPSDDARAAYLALAMDEINRDIDCLYDGLGV